MCSRRLLMIPAFHGFLRKIGKFLPAAFVLALVSCATAPRDRVYQTSTIDALLAGIYEGDLTCRELMGQGDFGIGTFEGLDGEMILDRGQLFQVKSDGKVYRPDTRRLKTPFATVCRFRPDKEFALKPGSSFSDVEKLIDEKAPNQNVFVAIRITGRFRDMHTRSVPGQRKPYPPLSAVTAHQPEFLIKETTGTIVGFRCPAFVKGVNVPGYHLHYVDNARACGGHILGFEVVEAEAEIDALHEFVVTLPKANADFANTDLSRDRGAELRRVEKAQE